MISNPSRYVLVGALVISAIAGLSSPTKAKFQQDEAVVLSTANRPTADVRGYARGTVALFKTLGSRDAAQQRCMGYGSLAPDHVVEVSPTASRLMLQLKTRSQDTTLIVEGPNQQLYCADDSPTGHKDAGLVLTNVKAGHYKVWVGTFKPGAGFRYTLSLEVF